MITRHRVVFTGILVWAAFVVIATFQMGAVATAGGTIALLSAGLLVAVSIIGFLTGAWLAPLMGSLSITALGLASYGLAVRSEWLIGIAVLGLIIVGASAAVAYQLAEQFENSHTSDRQQMPKAARLEELLSKLHEHSMLSETAKRVLFREKELELLRNVIEDDIQRGEYNAALRLCDDMANLFGYREEAETFRSRIDRTRSEDYHSQVHGAMEQLNALLSQRDWPRVHEVAARIRRLFQDQHVIEDVGSRINRARAEHKDELEAAFLDAAEREDVELAMERLKQLDHYLTPEETERLQEIAQDVVYKHKANLGVQFKLAVNDHRWVDAARVGDSIIAEFPNTKMAEEVRSMIDVLRTRATQAAVAAGPDRG